MTTVNVHDAKTHFSKLLTRVGSGEEIIIAKAGKPVARMLPIVKKTEKRVAGSAKGRILIKEDFYKHLPEKILKEFEK